MKSLHSGRYSCETNKLLMFWRKLTGEATYYHCLGINYREEVEAEGRYLDKEKEQLFKRLTTSSRVYTLKEIHFFSKRVGFDVWKAFCWLEATSDGRISTQMIKSCGIRYRFNGFKEALFDTETRAKAEKLFVRGNFYSHLEVEKASKRLCVSFPYRCYWEPFHMWFVRIVSQNTTREYQVRVNITQESPVVR